MSRGSADARSPGPFKQYSVQTAHKSTLLSTVWFDFPRRGGAFRETTSKDRFRRALLLMKPAHTGHHPGAVPGFRPSPGNSEETTTRVLTEEISVLFRVPTWDPTHPGSPVSRALPGNTPTQGPTREGKPGFFLGGGGNPGRNPGHGLGKTRERGGFRVFSGWYCWGLHWTLQVRRVFSRNIFLRPKPALCPASAAVCRPLSTKSRRQEASD